MSQEMSTELKLYNVMTGGDQMPTVSNKINHLASCLLMFSCVRKCMLVNVRVTAYLFSQIYI